MSFPFVDNVYKGGILWKAVTHQINANSSIGFTESVHEQKYKMQRFYHLPPKVEWCYWNILPVCLFTLIISDMSDATFSCLPSSYLHTRFVSHRNRGFPQLALVHILSPCRRNSPSSLAQSQFQSGISCLNRFWYFMKAAIFLLVKEFDSQWNRYNRGVTILGVVWTLWVILNHTQFQPPVNQCKGLTEGPMIVIGRADGSSGVPGMDPRFVSYKYCSSGTLHRKLLYREHVWHFHVGCLAKTQPFTFELVSQALKCVPS